MIGRHRGGLALPGSGGLRVAVINDDMLFLVHRDGHMDGQQMGHRCQGDAAKSIASS